MKLFVKILKRAIIAILMIVLIVLISIPIVNDITAIDIKNNLVSTPLPQNTEICDSLSAAGKLTGSGNGMQFFGAILIKTGLSVEAIEQHYSKYRNNEFEFIIAAQSQAQIEAIEHGSYSFSYLEDTDDLTGYYIVYTWGNSNYSLGDFDLRAH